MSKSTKQTENCYYVATLSIYTMVRANSKVEAIEKARTELIGNSKREIRTARLASAEEVKQHIEDQESAARNA